MNLKVKIIFFLSLFLYEGEGRGVFLTPSNNGASGLIRVISADNIGSGNWAFRVDANYVKYRDIYIPQEVNNTFRFFDTTFSYITGLGPIGELGISTDVRIANLKPENSGDVTLINGGNIHFLLKLGYMTSSGFGLNVYGKGDFYSSRDHIYPEINATSGGGGLLFTFDFLKMREIPLRIHINGGYYYDRREKLMNSPSYNGFLDYSYGIFHDDAIEGGIGVEFPIKYITPFIEYFTRQIIDADGDKDTNYSYNDSPQIITTGFRITPVRGLGIDIYYNQSLSDRDEFKPFYRYPPWTIGVGISFSFLPRIPKVEFVKIPYTPPEKNTVDLGVKILDSDTGEPVRDAIVGLEVKGSVRVATDDKGEATIKDILPDEMYKIVVERRGYKTAKVNIKPDKHNKKMFLIKIKRTTEEAPSELIGRIMSTGGKPLPAVVQFKTGNIQSIATNPITGGFRLQLPSGKYKIQINSTGYESVEREVVLEEKSLVYIDVVLKPSSPPPPPPPLQP